MIDYCMIVVISFLCLFVVICRDLIVPANGMISYSDPNIPRAVGSTASYSCSTGYTFSGTLTRTCTTTGWTDDTPMCTSMCTSLLCV